MTKRLVELFLFSIIIFSIVSCSGDKKDKTDKTTKKSEKALQKSMKWNEFISAYTSGTISRKSNIKVYFSKDIISDSEVGKDVSDIFEFSPSVKGKATWEGTEQLVFIPSEPLESGKKYKVTIKLDKWIKFKGSEKGFSYSFETTSQSFEVRTEGLVSISKTNQELHGSFKTADFENSENIPSVLKAFQNDAPLEIKWTHNQAASESRFVIPGIKRAQEDSEVVLKWDGTPINVKKIGERKIKVPALGKFKVLRARAVKNRQKYIEIRFSDQINKNQNLRGLIKIKRKRLKFSIDGNIVKVYMTPEPKGKVTFSVQPGIKSSYGFKLKKSFKSSVTFETVKPAVRFVGKGNIVSGSEDMLVPFEAVMLRSVQVTAFKVFPKNMGFFLQSNNLSGSNDLTRVGRYIWRKSVNLGATEDMKNSWSRYSLDVSDLFKKHPSSLFRLELSFNPTNSAYNCEGKEISYIEPPFKNYNDWGVVERSSWDYSEQYYSQQNYSWSDRRNPCSLAYYKYNRKKIFSAKNFIASNIGITVKRGSSRQIHYIITDLRTAEPVSDARIKLFNFQNQSIGESITDENGFGMIESSSVPFYITAEKDGDNGYLKLNGDSALQVSHFDVSGEKVKGGIKGHIYGERGVWRPGDNIHLTFVLEDKKSVLPPDHPVIFELIDPNGKITKSLKPVRSTNNFYAFTASTDEESPTGGWKARVRVGGIIFEKNLKIETVVPNRLKVNLDFGTDVLKKSSSPIDAKLFSQWLHGADASNLAADVHVSLTTKPTKFTRFTDYKFDDPARTFSSAKQLLFDGRLDEKGKTDFGMNINIGSPCPGMLKATFASRVFEQSGNFSSDTVSVPFHPYENYVGIKPPKGDAARGMLLTDIDHSVKIGSLSSDGIPVSLSNIEVGIYKISWKWWWDKSGESLASYASSEMRKSITHGKVSTVDGNGEWKFKIKYPSWGRYLIRACDTVGGHCTGKIVYIDWPGWAGRARQESGSGATRLNFNSDKQSYIVGENATIFLPETKNGKALITIENGSDLIKKMWVSTESGKNKFTLPITAEMAPNVYVHASLIQPHVDKKNDKPIRLYGIIPIKVSNPATIINPQIYSKDELKPLKETLIKVSEKDGKPMTYTLMVVDEGLLGLTRYKTPDLHKQFYKREALGIKTWDLFDSVAGAYGAALERILAIGGDEDADEKERESEKRFPPLVRFLGPFYLESGDTGKHRVKLPQYIGAVRIMVVAGDNGAYGKADKSVPVKDDLMLLSTLPRVLGPSEELNVPVSVFAINPKINKVSVSIETDDRIKLVDTKLKTLTFAKPEDKMAFFKIKVGDRPGKTKIKFRASSSGVSTEETINIEVRSPNPPTSRVVTLMVEPGKSAKTKFVPHGLSGTNKISLEVAAIKPINLEKRLDYLIRYPHGCVEQTTSSVFPQLYLASLTKLSPEQKKQIDNNIDAGIDRLKGFQVPSGGFSYWPTSGAADEWASNYAGNFLVEAQKAGYYVPVSMLDSWKNYQSSKANSFTTGSAKSALTQAARLYTLALAGSPDFASMNRLRLTEKLENIAAWQLAAAFAISGQKQAGIELVKSISLKVKEYKELGGTYGSSTRDRAIILNSLFYLGMEDLKLTEEVSDALASDKWLSTQATAYALMSIALPLTGTSNVSNFNVKSSTFSGDFTSDSPLFKKELKNFPLKGDELHFGNNSDKPLYFSVTGKGVPKAGSEIASSKGLKIDISYRQNGSTIDLTYIPQGVDIVATIKVKNLKKRSLKNLVLTHIIPSGWQIHNPRFETGASPVDYQDIRDDRIYTYFDLRPRESKTFKVVVNSSFTGKYYLPGINVEAMYDAEINAREKGQWIEIIK